MDINSFNNLAPIDNRYKKICDPLRTYLSDYGMNKMRCEVEIKYLIMLLNYHLDIHINENELEFLSNIYLNFSNEDLNNVRKFESKTNHDIKAIEYFIKDKIKNNDKFSMFREYIHFALTSQDINSVTNTLSIKRSVESVLIPNITNILEKLDELSLKWSKEYMISRTHGQAAVTTSMGKEMNVYKYRINIQLEKLINLQYTTKFGGAVGNLNAHYFCYDKCEWDNLLDKFILESFNISRNKYTTQIDNYDNLCEIFDIIKRINNILLDMNQDIWFTYLKTILNLKLIMKRPALQPCLIR